jgi:hypothetical protein
VDTSDASLTSSFLKCLRHFFSSRSRSSPSAIADDSNAIDNAL